jgi:hypothetical protein
MPNAIYGCLSPALPAVGIAALTAYAIAPKKLRALSMGWPSFGTWRDSCIRPYDWRRHKVIPPDSKQ